MTASTADLFDLTDKVVIVTGASSGLGARTAELLAGAGAQVVLAARRAKLLNDLAGTLGARAVAQPCDVTVGGDMDTLVSTTMERFGRIDVLINNAGRTDDGRAAVDQSDEMFASVVALNLNAAFGLARRVAPIMLTQESGTIINVASVLGLVGLGRVPSAGYAASKAGLINLTRELAAQWGPGGVRVNALAPGFFPSELTTEMFGGNQGVRFVEQRTLLGRVGSIEDLDGAMLYLCSDASSYMTGQVLVVDGGWTAV